ncbi:Mediator of RNA polymerase II transcription subunit 6 [Portunus trituberculatus]|uniref:Mediator of RNA polymerase II transcription subunit 6 n=1 Tax=Portunus trituberculatus TaxID=210409 RepID=A0A5B7FAR6_PORTR|nr:Mediator of RNA polymerase II transcription subunit 6 [Portunus trituberculatus]
MTYKSPLEVQLLPNNNPSSLTHFLSASQGYINDIALLVLAKDAQWSPYVRPVCLPDAKADGMKDAMNGDSGGPLVSPADASTPRTCVGLVSAGLGCGRPKMPGLYTRVDWFVDWILENMRSRGIKLAAVSNLNNAFTELQMYSQYHPSKGYWWQFRNHPDSAAAANAAAKDKEKKQKATSTGREEPASVFQHRRVGALLEDLQAKFPYKYPAQTAQQQQQQQTQQATQQGTQQQSQQEGIKLVTV